MPLLQAGNSLAQSLSQDDQNSLYQDSEWYKANSDIGGSCTTTLTGSDPIQKAFNYFVSNGLSPEQAAAVVGNLDAESGLNPEQIQIPPGGNTQDPTSITDPAVGWGIAQWTPASKIIGIAASLGVNTPIYQLSTQLDIVLGEMKGTSPTGVKDLISGLEKINDVASATVYFQTNFEGGIDAQARIIDAQQILKQYGGSSTPVISNGCGGGTTGPGGCVNPFSQIKNLGPERIDMGVDYAAPAGSKILAMCNAQVVGAASGGTGWTSRPVNTQACVYLKITSGTYSGKSYYVCEDIVPTVKTGQTVNAGDVIAKFLPSPTGIETGWGSGSPYGALAAQLNQECQTGDPGCWSTAAGVSFNRFLKSTGAEGGVFVSGAPPQRMPAGYP